MAKLTFDNRSSSSDTLEDIGKKLLQSIIEKGIYEEYELDVINSDTDIVRYSISVDSTFNTNGRED
jgi:hypothetical protein